jgi:DNA-binding NarL/FixJ family response regulator
VDRTPGGSGIIILTGPVVASAAAESSIVLVSIDEALYRDAVRAAIDAEPDLCVAPDFGYGGDILNQARRCRPDVALLKAATSGRATLELTKRLLEEWPKCRVLLLMDQDDPALLVEALKVGARGCVTRDTPLRTFIDSVRLVRHGQLIVPSHMLQDVIGGLIHYGVVPSEALERIARLTARERIVLGLLAEGGSNQSIARALFISPLTTRTHIQNLLVKLGVHSRLEAAMFVARMGSVSPARTTVELSG